MKSNSTAAEAALSACILGSERGLGRCGAGIGGGLQLRKKDGGPGSGRAAEPGSGGIWGRCFGGGVLSPSGRGSRFGGGVSGGVSGAACWLCWAGSFGVGRPGVGVQRFGQSGRDGLLSGPGLEGRSRDKLALSGRGFWSRASRDWGGVLAPSAPGSSEACGCGVFVGAGTLRSRRDVAKRFAPAGGRRFCSGRRSDSAPSGTGTKKGTAYTCRYRGPSG